jgi:two-component system chemotaxis response regulator CheY
MIKVEDEMVEEFLGDCCEDLSVMEEELFMMASGGAGVKQDRIDRVYRAARSVAGGAGMSGFLKIRDLARHMEAVVALLSVGKPDAAGKGLGLLVRATERLHELIHNPGTSNQADIGGLLAELDGLAGREAAASREPGSSPRILLVEDDFASRLLLQTFLSRYGECHIAVNGREAVEAVRSAWAQGHRYDLICMDIMMPEMDGREAVREVRAIEEAHGVLSTAGAKIVMTTTVNDILMVSRCFRELCDGYLVKPIDLSKLLDLMRSYRLSA